MNQANVILPPKPQRRFGAIPQLSAKQVVRFWSHVRREGDNECWQWIGAQKKAGYGEYGYSGHMYRAHRIAYFLAYGPIPEKQCVCHTCDVPACVNPSHLFAATHLENVRDMDRKGRGNRLKGEAHGRAILTTAQVAEIRKRYQRGVRGHGYSLLAREYGVHTQNVVAIIKGHTWKSVAS